jgi:cobalt/nickel transport system ATP-binding protein
MIKLSDVSYSYLDNIAALCDVNLEIKKGERVVIIGSNGSGKSTLMKIISALIYPLSGRYFYKDREPNLKTLKKNDVHFLVRSEIAYLFEDSDSQLFSPKVYEELIFGPKQLGLSDSECKKKVEAVVDMIDISDLLSRPSYTLSGGEKKGCYIINTDIKS